MTKEQRLVLLKQIEEQIYVSSLESTLQDDLKSIAIHSIIEEETERLEQEPNTGRWIGIDEEPHEDYECNRCGYVVSTYTANIEPHTEYKYCPNCGAKMVEQQESEE